LQTFSSKMSAANIQNALEKSFSRHFGLLAAQAMIY
jgi:hypothetical protein